jgi:hypothetical protein
MPFKTVDVATKYAAKEVAVSPEMCPPPVWVELCGAIPGLKCFGSHVSMPKKNTLKPLVFLSCIASVCPVHDRDHTLEKPPGMLDIFNIAYDAIGKEVIMCCFQSGKKTIKRMAYTPSQEDSSPATTTAGK